MFHKTWWTEPYDSNTSNHCLYRNCSQKPCAPTHSLESLDPELTSILFNPFHATGLFRYPPENIRKALIFHGGVSIEISGMKWVNFRFTLLDYSSPSSIYLFKANDGDTKKMCKIGLKIVLKTSERGHLLWIDYVHFSPLSINDLEQVNAGWDNARNKIRIECLNPTLKHMFFRKWLDYQLHIF